MTRHEPLQTFPKSRLDRVLSLVTDVRAGEGATAILMVANIFLLLVCYSVIKTVREPLILLGGGAEVRSYAAAGQALLLVGFVPAYAWFVSRVDRVRLLVGTTAFFVLCIELFAVAVAVRTPFIGVAFFIWVGIFNVSLIALFWSFANDLYRKEAGTRLFPIIVIGMTAGAPLGSLVAGRLFGAGIAPQVILQIAAGLLSISAGLYLWINHRETGAAGTPAAPPATAGGFGLVLRSRYLMLIALLVVLLNVVNTTGEYLVARLLTAHANELAALTPGFDRQAFIGAFSGDYQFWVNIVALLLQLLVTSRLVKYAGLGGALLVLPLIALGGYAIIAAGAGFTVVRWIKTTENATDYSVMNTARQLLWLPVSREEKYKAKQAIDTFFVRAGDVLSAGVVYLGTAVWGLSIPQFAAGNVALTVVWLGVVLLVLRARGVEMPVPSRRALTTAAAAGVALLIASQSHAQESRQEVLAAARAEKATDLHPYVPNSLERRIELADRLLMTRRSVYMFMGSAFEGGGLALGPGYRGRLGDTGTINAHAALSIRGYKVVDGSVGLPAIAGGRLRVTLNGSTLDAPGVAFYRTDDGTRTKFGYRNTTLGARARFSLTPSAAVGGGLDYVDLETTVAADVPLAPLDLTYRRTSAFAEIDTRPSAGYSRRGGLYRLDWSNYQQANGTGYTFQRIDAEARQFIPVLRENWVIALRALASTTTTAAGEDVPYVLRPDLGGSRALRGQPSWRFRDRHRVLFTGEYRWTAGPFVDMALFMDAGTTAPRWGDLDLGRLETSQGIGLTIHTPDVTVMRLELARSGAGLSLSLAFSPSF